MCVVNHFNYQILSRVKFLIFQVARFNLSEQIPEKSCLFTGQIQVEDHQHVCFFLLINLFYDHLITKLINTLIQGEDKHVGFLNWMII